MIGPLISLGVVVGKQLAPLITSLWSGTKQVTEIAKPVLGAFQEISKHRDILLLLKKFTILRPVIILLLTYLGVMNKETAIHELSSPEITGWNLLVGGYIAVCLVSVYVLGKLYWEDFKQRRGAKVEAQKKIIMGQADLELEKKRIELELYKKKEEQKLEYKHKLTMAKVDRKAACIAEGKSMKECKINNIGNGSEDKNE